MQRDDQQNKTQYIKEISEIGWVSWVTGDDFSVLCIDGMEHEFCLDGMVNPLTKPNKHCAEREKQSMSISNAFYINSETGNHPRCTKCDKEVTPVLNLYPGLTFTHKTTPLGDQKKTPASWILEKLRALLRMLSKSNVSRFR